MNSTHPSKNLTLTDLIKMKIAPGLDLQLMPTQAEQRVAIVSTELARWYIVDPDSREEHEQLLRRQRQIFDAFAESCLKGFRRYFSKVMSTKAIATVGELVVGPSGTEFAGDITMIEYGDGARATSLIGTLLGSPAANMTGKWYRGDWRSSWVRRKRLGIAY